MVRHVLIAALAAGCYEPSIDACQYKCAGVDTDPDSVRCPEGLVCNFQDKCTATFEDRCQSTTCGWPVISNIDPCTTTIAASVRTETWTIDTDTLIDTDLPSSVTVPNGSFLNFVTQSGSNVDALVIVVGNFVLKSTLRVRGSRPLILLVNGTATIDDGKILGEPTVSNPLCRGEDATAVINVGGCGGAGGSFGSGPGYGGAQGGRCGEEMNHTLKDNFGRPGQVVVGNEALTPIRGGCDGGRGAGYNGATGGGAGGVGGGGIQISAKTKISIKGVIDESGGGGRQAQTKDGGGGGGGAGGGILLEAPIVDLTSGVALLCAHGGGGGAGTDDTGVGAASPGLCTDSPQAAAGGGFLQLGTHNHGGSGGVLATDATPGADGFTTSTATDSLGGGGGGGSVGRIRINTGPNPTAGRVESPTASHGLLL